MKDKICSGHLDWEIGVMGRHKKDATKRLIVGRAYVCRKHRAIIEFWKWPMRLLPLPIQSDDMPIKSQGDVVSVPVGITDQTKLANP